MANALLKQFSETSMVKELAASEVQELFEITDETSLKKGSVLFKEGDEGDALYVLLEGRCEVTKKGTGLATLDGGAVIGEMSLIGGEVRSATVTAATDIRLLKISAARFQKLLKKENLAALKVVNALARVMSKRLSLITDKLVASVGSGKPQKKEELADFGKILNHWSF